ncbi:MAG: hypothetical protein ACKV2O_08625 [Acidimicrobiales bacterium]
MGVKRKLIGIVGFLVFLSAGAFLVLKSGSAEPETELARAQVPMLVAIQSIKAGTSVDKVIENAATLLSVSMVDVEARNPDALTAIEELTPYKGQVFATEMALNAPLLTTTFVDRGALTLAAGGVDIPEDLLQLSFSLEPQRVLGGSLRAGDRVAVLMSNTPPVVAEGQTPMGQTHIIVQKALLANVQLANLANAGDGAPGEETAPLVVGNYMVTLALSASDTERMTNALEFGRIWLAKQPDPANGENTKVWDVEDTMTEPVTAYKLPAK